MTWPIGESGAPSKLPLRCATAIAGALLVAASVFGVPSTSADEVTGTVEGAVGSVTTTPVQGLPSTPSPPTPPAPVATPTAPQQIPVSPAKLPTEAAPTSSQGAAGLPDSVTRVSSKSTAGTDFPSAGGTRTVAGASTEATRQSSASVRGSPDLDSPRQGIRHRGTTTSGGGHRSIESAKVAPRSWFFVYVWPAVALGRDGGLLTTLLSRLEGANSLPVAEAARIFLGLDENTQADGDSPPPDLFGIPNSPSVTPFDTGSSTGLKIFLATAALLAVLAVWAEFNAATRPRRRG